MNTQERTAAEDPIEPTVARPNAKRAKALSYRQRELLAKAPIDWERLPTGHGCTSLTLTALETRGLIETTVHYEDNRLVPGNRMTVWKWRKTPNDGCLHI